MNRLIGTAMAVLLCGAGAGAQESGKDNANSATIGIGLICNTAQQVERYLALYKDGASAQKAMNVVNTEERNPKACGIVAAAFVVGEQHGKLVVPGGTAKIVEITIVAAHTGRGWKTTAPTVQYTAVFEDGEEA
jgi:hypothetical protein